MVKAVALIPVRSGSTRIKDKNIKLLNGHPLIAYAISAALQSGVFDDVVVSTDNQRYADLSVKYGAQVPFMRPPQFAGDVSPDFEWVNDTILKIRFGGKKHDVFSILRPTSPFRHPATIRKAMDKFLSSNTDSLRAVELCKQHPGKMWVVRDNDTMIPIMPYETAKQPWHSSPYQSLPVIYAQNASLEIAWTRVVLRNGNISGDVIVPFGMPGYEGFDINTADDWDYAEYLIEKGKVTLPNA